MIPSRLFHAQHLVLALLIVSTSSSGCRENVVRVGSKNFNENILLGEIIAQQLERSGLEVRRDLDIGYTADVHDELMRGRIDIYPEYTATAYTVHLRRLARRADDGLYSPIDSVYRERLYAFVDSAYETTFNLTMLGRFGFENTYAVLTRAEEARELGLHSLSDVAKVAAGWRFAADPEFYRQRPDGFDSLATWYKLSFESVLEVPLDSIYVALALKDTDAQRLEQFAALAAANVDIAVGNSTDSRIKHLFLEQLDDDLNFFLPYEAAPVLRHDHARAEDIVRALEPLCGAINDSIIVELNYMVDIELRDVADVAEGFLDGLEEEATRRQCLD